MHSLKLVAAAMLLMPTVGLAQENKTNGAKAKAWMVNNFQLVIKGVAVQDGHTYLKVQSRADIDQDGIPDEGIVRLQCAGDELRAAHYSVKSPRDSASGQASGKRTHHPVTFIKEWGASTPQFKEVKVTSTGLPKITPKIAMESVGRFVASGWEPITLAETATVCSAAGEATKSRSNIQNNRRGEAG